MNDKSLESNFMALSINDFIKSVGPAIFGAVLPLIVPIYNSITSSLLAGNLPALPTASEASTLLIKCLGISITSASGYLMHKFFSNEVGSPFNGSLDKYMVSVKNQVSPVETKVQDTTGTVSVPAGLDRFAGRVTEEKK